MFRTTSLASAKLRTRAGIPKGTRAAQAAWDSVKVMPPRETAFETSDAGAMWKHKLDPDGLNQDASGQSTFWPIIREDDDVKLAVTVGVVDCVDVEVLVVEGVWVVRGVLLAVIEGLYGNAAA